MSLVVCLDQRSGCVHDGSGLRRRAVLLRFSQPYCCGRFRYRYLRYRSIHVYLRLHSHLQLLPLSMSQLSLLGLTGCPGSLLRIRVRLRGIMIVSPPTLQWRGRI